jgi:hypothetical protein
MKKILVFITVVFSIAASAQQQVCTAYCLDVRAMRNSKTKQVENHFDRSPLLKAGSYAGLVTKCQANYGTALLLDYRFEKTRASSKLTSYKLAKAQNACKSI